MIIDYLFLDPFSSTKSGVSAYIKSASAILNKHLKVFVLKIGKEERLEDFRLRVFEFVRNNVVKIIESPETRTATKYLNAHDKIHIRLHGSRVVGDYVQNIPIKKDILEDEQKEINKAWVISAPSLITVQYAKKFFYNLDSVAIFPNPTLFANKKFSSRTIKCSPRVFFIGRGENLKGIFFIKKIQEGFKGEINIIGDERLRRYIKKNKIICHFFNGEDGQWGKYILPGDIVIVLSIFETWSMVISESISRYCQVISWEHLGICEFANNFSYIYKINPWDIYKFSQALNMMSKIESIKPSEFIQFLEFLNKEYYNNILNLHHKESFLIKKYNANKVILPEQIDFITINLVKSEKTMRLKQKFMKLINDPGRFIYDSRFIPEFIKNKFHKSTVPVSNIPIVKDTKNRKDVNIKNNNVKNLEAGKEIKSWSLLGTSPSGFITFPKIETKRPDLKTMILVPERMLSRLSGLDELLYLHKDFYPLRKEELLCCTYRDELSELNIDNIMAKLNIDNRNRLSNIQNIFVFDDTENLATALFFCNYELKVIQIFPEAKKDVSNVLNCYIMPYDDNILNESLQRKCFYYEDNKELSLVIRKVLQEIIPRDVNLLLPVISSTEYNPQLIQNRMKCDVLVKLKDGLFETRPANHLELCFAMSNLTISLYATEKTFLNYQNLLINPNVNNIAIFYELASKDGLYFEVES